MRSEFDFIQNIKNKYGLKHIGDDCAVLPKDAETDMVITADMLVEDIDFRIGWTTPEFLGHKALAVSLSDIASMGAVPDWAMVSIGVPPLLWEGDFLDRFYVGWHKLATGHGVELIGGDLSRTPERLVIDSVVIGSVPRGEAVMRSGARPGDGIYVSGRLGGAAAGLHHLESGARLESLEDDKLLPVILRQLRPEPRLEFAESLRSNRIPTAMIDLSDGLSSDLRHLIEASGVGARIWMDLIPMEEHIFVPGTSFAEFEKALHGGEDFELLFTADAKKISPERSVDFQRIGEITANTGMIELIVGNKTEILDPKGYRHF